jgi:hypothetical protein
MPAAAQIQRDPNGVNVNSSSATTVFITFGNLDGKVPVEAMWCGELIPATPDIGFKCDPSTIFGNLPLRYDLGRASGIDGFTDIMTIPASVSRRAYQAAAEGATSSFFYVRRFEDPAGGPDEYVFVTCRMAGGGARVPFALLDVRIAFDTEDLVLSIGPGETPPPIKARILYNGTGRLTGRWEVVLPGEEPPTSQDLLTEATLPVELRGTQRRYTELERFNEFLPPTGEFVLEGPDVSRLPTHLDGLYLVLLRIEATDDKEADSSLDRAQAGTGVVHAGAVAGFPIPPLRYYVGGAEAVGLATNEVGLLAPADRAVLSAGEPIVFSWTSAPGTILFRLEVQNAAGEEVLAALLQSGTNAYRPPPWFPERVGPEPFRWRVVALGPDGSESARTPWRSAQISATAAETANEISSIQGGRK